MAKIKRKHLAALDVQKRQKLPAQEAPIRPLSPNKEESSPNAEQPTLPSPTPLLSRNDREHSTQHDGERDLNAEISCTSLSARAAGYQAQADTKPLCLQQHGDPDSDCNSWVEVRKQRIVIIIPPAPEATPKPHTRPACLRKDNTQCTSRQKRAVLPEDRSRDKGPSSKVYGKKSWKKKAIRSLETERKGNGKRTRKKISRDPPPISSMDILLASALGTDHSPWHEKPDHNIDLLASCTQEEEEEEASLDTADSSIQPKSSLVKRRKLVIRNKGASKVHCKPAHGNKAKELTRPQQDTCVLNNLRSFDHVHTYERQGIGDSPVLSVSQSIRVVILKKHVEKAGGLKGWLSSLGLGQFKEAFGKRVWSEWDLLQLRMEDLRQMGKPAVGPRRKLICAIQHLSQQMI